MATPKSFLSIAAVGTAAVGLALLSAACSSGDDGPPSSDNGGAGGGTSISPEAGSGDDDADSGLTQEEINACDELEGMVDDQIAQATGADDYPNTLYSCATDSDCVVLDDSTRCGKSCGVVIAQSHAAAYAKAISAADAQFCGGLSGCPGYSDSCPVIGAAACYGNSCTFGLPSAWESLVFETDTGGSGSTLPATCSGASCTLWKLTPDGKVVVTNGSSTVRTATLSSADFATIDGLLRSVELREQATSGTTCPKYDGSEHASESVARTGISVGGDVSSCVAGMYVGDAATTYAASDYLTLYNVLKGY